MRFMHGDIRVGISGWRYKPWRGVFYPEDLPQHRELEFASRQVNSIEINGSFYSLQRSESYHHWHDATPEGFVFSIKGSRYITHLRRLKEVETPLANFFASGILALRNKLGPFLWQFPPNFSFKPERLAAFFKLLPRDTNAAAKLAGHHTELVKNPWFNATEFHPLRHAIEVRHASFQTREFIELLREHEIALVVADTAGKWPFMEDVTADFIYVRLHGDEELYVSGYTPEAIANWAEKIRSWSRGSTPKDAKLLTPSAPQQPRDIYVYFDNDVKVRAPADAIALSRLLKLNAPVPLTLAPRARIKAQLKPSNSLSKPRQRPAISSRKTRKV
jgi:uncharacterized protein YecE (DUF72 family)